MIKRSRHNSAITQLD